jgi:hypothetical protein
MHVHTKLKKVIKKVQFKRGLRKNEIAERKCKRFGFLTQAIHNIKLRSDKKKVQFKRELGAS